MKYAQISLGMLTLLAVSSCRMMDAPPLLPEDEERVTQLETVLQWYASDQAFSPDYEVGSYEYFVSHRYYLDTMVVYRDRELLKQATADSPVYICLSQQRGRLYVDGQVALDWPVSTGTKEKPTSRGHFCILEKKQSHYSGRFGSILDASGNVLVADADSRRHSVPPGGRWKGAEMPNWMRLTDSGIGMHTGMVVPGKRLSHGCIRMPHEVSSRLFEILELKSRVYVQDGVEECFPCRTALQKGDELRERHKVREETQAELESFREAAQERAEKAYAADEARRKADEEARERAEAEAEAVAEAQRLAAEVAERAAEEARERAERARRKAEGRAAEEARERAEEEAEAKAKAERQAAREAARAERARRKAEERAAEEARERAEEEAEAKAKAERARRKAEERAAKEARERAEEEAKAKAKAERARRKAEERAAEEARERAEEEAKAKARAQRARLRAAERAQGGSWWARTLRRVGL